MSRQNARCSRRLAMESLETRQMMTGNVLVSVSAGNLVVSGDSGGNELRIIQSLQNGAPIAGRFFITGQNGTTINGQSVGQFFQNVSGDLRINLNGGNDRLTLGDGVSNSRFIAPRDLQVDMGDGNDVVRLDRVSVRDDARLVTGAGSDSVFVKGTIGGLAGVDFGQNDLTIDTGDRADNISLENVFVRHNLNVNTGSDDFTDFVDMHFMNIGNDTDVRTGGGGDIVRISDVGFNDDLTIDTGAGNDSVSIDRCQVDELFLSLGTDSDALTLRNTVGRRASLNGGLGSDTLSQSGNSFSQFFGASGF